MANLMQILKRTNKSNKKIFKPLDIVLFTFSAVFVLDSLGLSLTIGWASIFWWIFLGLIFFLPYGLITAELATTYPKGGIYSWVVNGLGKKMGARSNFFYWLNVAFWMPSVYLVLGSTFIQSINPSLLATEWFVWVNMGIAITATWITWAINKVDLNKAKWLPNAGSIIKAVLVVFLLTSMVVFLARGNEIQSSTSGETGFMPNWTAPFGVIGIIVYNMCGFELSTNLGENIKEVKKTIPKSLLIGGITIICAYLIASIPAFVTLDVGNNSFQSGGYVNSIVNVFASSLPNWLVIILAGFLAITLITNMLSWTLGSNRAISEAAAEGQMPKSFALSNKCGSPTFASLIMSIISTIAIVIASIMEFVGAGQAYFVLFSFSLIIFFIPYLMIFASYIKLRNKNSNISRPFEIKNNFLAKFLGGLAFTVVLVASITQVLEISFVNGMNIAPVPAFGEGLIAWLSLGGTFAGIIVSIIIGEILIWWANKKNNNPEKEIEHKDFLSTIELANQKNIFKSKSHTQKSQLSPNQDLASKEENKVNDNRQIELRGENE